VTEGYRPCSDAVADALEIPARPLIEEYTLATTPARARTRHLVGARLVGLVVGITLIAGACASSGSGGGSGSLPSITVTVPDGGVTTIAPDGGDATTSTPPGTEEPAATDPPKTEAPAATDPPKTEAPAETEPPKTEAPAETEPPKTEPAPVETTVAPEPSSPGASEDESSTWWPWVLGAVVLLGIGAAVVVGRRSRRGPSWADRARAALDEADQLSTHLAALAPAGVGVVATGDAARLATLGASLQQLVTTAPDASSRAALDQVPPRVAVLHATVDALALGQASPPSSVSMDALQAQAVALHTVTASARALLFPMPTV
jgi:hypothetical protein